MNAASVDTSHRIHRLMDGDIYLGARIPKRFIVSVAAILVVKALMAFTVYSWLNLGVVEDYWMNQSKVFSGPQNNILWTILITHRGGSTCSLAGTAPGT